MKADIHDTTDKLSLLDFPGYTDTREPHNEAASKASGLALGARVEFECIAALQ